MHIPSSTRLRSAVVAATVLMLVLVQLFAVLLTGLSARNDSIRVGREAINRVGDTTIESILRHLEPAQQSIGVTGRLIRDDLLSQERSDLERYLFTQLAVMPQMTGTFVGYPDGSFVFVSRNGEGFTSKRIVTAGGREVEVGQYDGEFNLLSEERSTDDDFDPRTRPWYELASESDDARWTDPYVFFSSGEPGVTAAQAVRSDAGELIAVAGVDVELSGLGEFLDDLPVASSGEAFVVSGMSVVAAPQAYGQPTILDEGGLLRLPQIDELGVSALDRVPDGDVRAMEVDGERELVLHRSFPPGQGLEWGLVVRVPESDFIGEINRQQRAVYWILIFGGVMMAASMMLMLRLTRPVRELHDLAATDGLTGIANRRTVEQLGERLIVGAHRRGSQVSALVIDLDRFKSLNDRRGHAAGDRALQLVAEYLRVNSPEGAVVGRLGGDEFVVVTEVEHARSATDEARELFDGLARVLADAVDHDISLKASGGFTVMAPIDADHQPISIDVLIGDADRALIDVKHRNRGSLALADHLQVS